MIRGTFLLSFAGPSRRSTAQRSGFRAAVTELKGRHRGQAQYTFAQKEVREVLASRIRSDVGKQLRLLSAAPLAP